jgi:hypothetical protein
MAADGTYSFAFSWKRRRKPSLNKQRDEWGRLFWGAFIFDRLLVATDAELSPPLHAQRQINIKGGHTDSWLIHVRWIFEPSRRTLGKPQLDTNSCPLPVRIVVSWNERRSKRFQVTIVTFPFLSKVSTWNHQLKKSFPSPFSSTFTHTVFLVSTAGCHSQGRLHPNWTLDCFCFGCLLENPFNGREL